VGLKILQLQCVIECHQELTYSSKLPRRSQSSDYVFSQFMGHDTTVTKGDGAKESYRGTKCEYRDLSRDMTARLDRRRNADKDGAAWEATARGEGEWRAKMKRHFIIQGNSVALMQPQM